MAATEIPGVIVFCAKNRQDSGSSGHSDIDACACLLTTPLSSFFSPMKKNTVPYTPSAPRGAPDRFHKCEAANVLADERYYVPNLTKIMYPVTFEKVRRGYGGPRVTFRPFHLIRPRRRSFRTRAQIEGTRENEEVAV